MDAKKLESNGEFNPTYVVDDEEKAYPSTLRNTNDDPQTPKMDYDPGEQRRMFKNVCIISFAFTFLFTAYNSMANLQSSLNSEDGLGTYSLSTLYASLVISSMFVPTYMIRKLTAKWTIFLAMFGYITYIGLQMYPRFYTLVPGAIIVGLCGAPLWSAKCTYLTLVGNQYASLVKDNAEVIVVRFFGIFFLFFQSSGIWGNLISSVVLSMGDNSNLTRDLDICGAKFCPGNDNSAGGTTSEDQVYLLAGIYIGCGLVAAAIIGIFVDSLMRYGEDKREGGASELAGSQLLLATMRHMVHPYQILIIPLTIWSGMEQGFFSAEYTQAYITCSWGIEKVGYVLICYAVCDAIASISFGPIIRRTGRVPIFTLGAIINGGVIITLFLWRPDPDAPVIYFVLSGLWGVADAIWQTQINAFYGVIFPNNTEPAFSNYRLWESIGFIIAYAISNEVCVKWKLWLLVVNVIIGMAGYYAVEYKEKRNPQIPQSNNNKLKN